ncbi:hypothetical protein [Microbispora sp. NPDC049125]|uniref:hypothetical protein n=1 Tax=Microbispora sp. NPDC049125 TaxID=3154929 RepID=UPI003466BA37
MSEFEAWSVLAKGDSGDVILSVDFYGTGRAEAGFHELAPKVGPAFSVLQTVIPATGLRVDVTAESYLEPWLSEIRASGLRVRAILGYCVGGVYAAAMAAEIAKWQDDAPEVLLFDPELVNAETIFWQFYKLVGSLSQVLTPEEAADVQAEGQDAFDETEDLAELTEALMAIFRRAGEAAFTRMGLGVEYAQELIDVFGAFMSYLAVADQIDPLPLWASATALTSASPQSGLNRVRASFTGDVVVAREIKFDVEHVDILRSDVVAAAAVELLAA